MLLLVLLGAAPIAFVTDGPVEVDGRRIEGRVDLPRKAAYEICAGQGVMRVGARMARDGDRRARGK